MVWEMYLRKFIRRHLKVVFISFIYTFQPAPAYNMSRSSSIIYLFIYLLLFPLFVRNKVVICRLWYLNIFNIWYYYILLIIFGIYSRIYTIRKRVDCKKRGYAKYRPFALWAQFQVTYGNIVTGLVLDSLWTRFQPVFQAWPRMASVSSKEILWAITLRRLVWHRQTVR